MAGDARPEDFWEKVQDLHQKNAELKAPLEQHAPPRCQCPLGYHLEGCPEQSKEPEEEPLCGCVTTGYHREGCPQRPEVGVPTAENQLWGRPAGNVDVQNPAYKAPVPGVTAPHFVTGLSVAKPAVRTFATGATRDTDEGKLDYRGFLHPLVLKRYAEFMHLNRKLKDGTLRASDNWTKGIGRQAYASSLYRHHQDVQLHMAGEPQAAGEDLETALCAVVFNAMGLLLEVLKGRDV